RTGITSTTLTVHYTVGGTATSGADYTPMSGTVTIPAGLTQGQINVFPIDDSVPECDETVVVTLSADPSYAIGSPDNETVTIFDNDLPSVSITATTPNASEALTNGVFRLTRNGCTNSPLTVNYTIGGTASNGLDYAAISNSMVIAAGQTNATVTI